MLVQARRLSTRYGQLLALAALLIAGCAGPTHAPTGMPRRGCDLSPETHELAAEFQRLRPLQGHFQGGAWNAEVDEWLGLKHRAMIELGSRLGGGDCTRAQVIDLLGPPDQIAGPGDALFDRVRRRPGFETPPAAAHELLIYYWRDEHDWLYFTADSQAISSSGWWHAYE